MKEGQQIRKIAIDAKGKVKIDFVEIHLDESEVSQVTKALTDDEPNFIVNEYSVKSPRLAHKDLKDAMKKLRKFALEICEMIFETKALTFYDICAIKINGDIALRQSRVILTVSKEVRRTGKEIKFNTPEVTMYGDSEYERASEMSKVIENVVSEAKLYLGGKCADGDQLPLFPKLELSTV